MSEKQKQGDQSQNQQSGQESQSKLTGADKIAADKAQEQAAAAAQAQSGDDQQSPEEAAKNQAIATGETEEQRIAKAVNAVHQVNPNLSAQEIADIVAKMFKKTETPQGKADKEAARILTPVDNTYKEKVYLKKDEKRQFPLEKEALNGIVVRQTYKRKLEEGDEVEVPARNLNEIAIYTQEEFDRLNNNDPKKPGFAREGITVEIWHKPGQTDTVQED